MPDKKLGLNKKEEKPSTGEDQPEEEKNRSSLIKEDDIDDILSKTKLEKDPEGDLDEDDDTITLSKEEFESLKEDRDNYRKGLLSVKDKLKAQSVEAEKAKAELNKDKEASEDDSKFVTRDELDQREQKKAIKEACKDNFIEKNWDEIMEYYYDPRGDKSAETYLKNIKRAALIYKSENDIIDEDDDSQDRAKLSEEEGQEFSAGGAKGKPKKKKRIIPKKSTIQNWYPKEK